MHHKNLNRKYVMAVLSTSIGSAFQHGYHAGVVNVAQQTIVDWIKTNKKDRMHKSSERDLMFTWSLAVAIFSVGGMVGSLLTAYFAKKFGHKGGLIWNNFIMFLAALLLSTAKYAKLFEVFILGRFLIGVNAGLSSGLCPIYLAEISPVSLRGATGVSYSLVYSVSIFLSQFLGLKNALGNKDYWPIIFGLSVIPAVFQLVALLHCPESPRYLSITLDDEANAIKALVWFRGTTNVTKELEGIREHKELLKQLPEVSIKNMFRDKFYRTPWIICLMMVLSQQCCGIDAAVYFSTKILTQVGFSEHRAQYATLIMGVLMVLLTLFCVATIDTIGRRKLFLFSFCGMAIDTTLLIVVLKLSEDELVKEYMKYCTMMAVVFFVAWYSVGTGAIPRFITVELFHHMARPLAVSMTIPVNWLANFIIGVVFLHLSDKMGSYYVFSVFVFFDLVLFLFVHMYLPETCGKTSGQIVKIFYNVKPYVHEIPSMF